MFEKLCFFVLQQLVNPSMVVTTMIFVRARNSWRWIHFVPQSTIEMAISLTLRLERVIFVVLIETQTGEKVPQLKQLFVRTA